MTLVTTPAWTALDTVHLKHVLDAIHYSQIIPDTPLKQFTTVQYLLGGIEPMAEGIACDVALVDWLNTTIRQELAFHRQHYDLPIPELLALRPHALNNLKSDFKQQNVELEAWSVLYFWYVRVDLALGWKGVAALAGQTTRNLRRRQAHGLHRLLHQLIQQEMHSLQQVGAGSEIDDNKVIKVAI